MAVETFDCCQTFTNFTKAITVRMFISNLLLLLLSSSLFEENVVKDHPHGQFNIISCVNPFFFATFTEVGNILPSSHAGHFTNQFYNITKYFFGLVSLCASLFLISISFS